MISYVLLFPQKIRVLGDDDAAYDVSGVELVDLEGANQEIGIENGDVDGNPSPLRSPLDAGKTKVDRSKKYFNEHNSFKGNT